MDSQVFIEEISCRTGEPDIALSRVLSLVFIGRIRYRLTKSLQAIRVESGVSPIKRRYSIAIRSGNCFRALKY